MLEIKTKDLKSRKRVLIDGMTFVVRKLGAGEELSISQKIRRINALAKKETKDSSLTQAEEQEVETIGNDILNTLADCFDDGEDGSKSRELVRTLSAEELKEVYDAIFTKETPTA